MRRTRIAFALALVMTPLIAASASPAGVPAAGARAIPPTPATGVPRLEHVAVIVMENHSEAESGRQPFLKTLVASSTTFRHAWSVAHPSQPNYFALWCGSTLTVKSDVCPAPGTPFHAENLGHACEQAGLAWRAYSEGLTFPGNDDCYIVRNKYVRRHDPWTNFDNLDHMNERPYSELAADVAANRVPNLLFVIPDMCNDGHDANCGGDPLVWTDRWLAANMPLILKAVGPRGLVILTWDEDDYTEFNQILTLFAGGAVKAGYVSKESVDHCRVNRVICDALGLPPMGKGAKAAPLRDVWATAVMTQSAPPRTLAAPASGGSPDPPGPSVRSTPRSSRGRSSGAAGASRPD